MAITLVTGPANAGKAQVVLDRLRAHLARGEDPLLVVPTRADAEHYLRELAGGEAALGARVERFDGLIDEMVRRAGVPRQTIGQLARERVLASAAANAGIDAAGPGLIRAAAAFVADMRARRVSPGRLAQALSQAGVPATATGLGRLYSSYDSELDRLGLQDRESRATRALDALRRGPALWGASPVLFYGFDDLTRLQLDAIETLGRVLDVDVCVSLAYERGRAAFAGRAATFQVLAPIAAEHRELAPREDYYSPGSRVALAHLERRLLEVGSERIDPGAAVRLLEGGGERAELELVAGEISRLLGAGMAPEEIAIVARAPAGIAELLEEVLTAAGIPFALQRREPLSGAAIGRALIGLLRCSADDGAPADLLAWLRAPGMLDRPELADLLEIRVRRTGTEDAAGARALWEERGWPLGAIDLMRESEQRGPSALIERAAAELERLFLAPRRGRAAILGAGEEREARALAGARAALSELRDLARRAAELAPASASDLARELERVEFVSGARPGPGTVAVLDPLALRARRVRALFLVGLCEGVFPARSSPQPILSDEERLQIAQASGLILGDAHDQLAAERYLLYAALSRPQELLYLSWHLATDDGEPVSRSLFVDDVLDLFDEALIGSRAQRPLGAADDAPPSDTQTHPLGPLRQEPVLSDLREHVWSASSLQSWIGCPVRWFIERMLRPGAIDPDAEPLARGALAHAALRDTLEGLRAQYGSARLTPARLASARELLHAALVENERRHPLSVAPERRPGTRRRLRADLERYLEHAAQADSPLEPRHLELGFGSAPGGEEGQEPQAGAVDLGGGVLMRGRIDRVDEDGSGHAVIYDYKSSSAPAPARWLAEGNLQVALYMHAVEQILGVEAAGGFYQPLSGPDLRARGVLDRDSAIELDCVRGDSREHERVRELVEEALQAARRAAAEAGRGELTPRPGTCAYNGGCMYPTICRCEP
jgi:ATP-dependent helicase/DNAse subunit B